MTNPLEKDIDKFPHLGEIPPEIKNITDLNPNDVKPEHLWFLDEHLVWLQIKFPGIANEIKTTREKIKIAMSGKINFVTWETMKAAIDDKYKEQALNIKNTNNREFRSIG